MFCKCILYLCFLCSCVAQKEHISLVKGNNNINSLKTQDASELTNISEIRKKYIDSYRSVIKLDTLFNTNGDLYQIKLKYYCLLDSALIIPKEYIFDKSKINSFVTHNFAADISIKKNDHTIYDKTIKKESFQKNLTNELVKYAVIKSPTKVYLKKDHFKINFSVSVPVTDIGMRQSLLVTFLGDDNISN